MKQQSTLSLAKIYSDAEMRSASRMMMSLYEDKVPTHFVGYLYDNAEIRTAVRKLTSQIDLLFEMRTSMAATGEFQGTGNYRSSRSEREYLVELLELEKAIAPKVLVDRKRVYRGLSINALTSSDRHAKATSKKYMDTCMRPNPEDPFLLDDIRGIFVTVDKGLATMKIKAVPARLMTSAMSSSFGLNDYLKRLNAGFFTAATAGDPREDMTPALRNPLRQIARELLRSDQYAGKDERDRIQVCFYENGMQGCVLGDRFSTSRMQLTGIDIGMESNEYLLSAWLNLDITEGEKAAFHQEAFRHMPAQARSRISKTLKSLKL